jgi:hypothetical protein
MEWRIMKILTLAAYPDSADDEKWGHLLGPMSLLMARMNNEPIREALPCECGGICTLWLARDHTNPEMIWSGVVCPNPRCNVLMTTVIIDPDGDDE